MNFYQKSSILLRPNLLFKFTVMIMLYLTIYGCDSSSENDIKPSGGEDKQITEAEKTSQDTFTILAIGDSLTEGLNVKKDSNYPAILEQSLHDLGYTHIKVINSGLSGETSSGLKNRLDWVLQIEPDLTILNIGANDAIRGLPLELTNNNINEIIERVKANDSALVLAGMQIYDNLGQEYVEGFKEIYPAMAEKHQLPMIPFFLEHVGGSTKLNQSDMIHPTAEGYAVIVEKNVLPVVLPLVEQLINEPQPE